MKTERKPKCKPLILDLMLVQAQNINKKRSPKNAELVLSCNNGGFPRYVLNQLSPDPKVDTKRKTVYKPTREESKRPTE